MKTNFEEVKQSILMAAKAAHACHSGYSDALRANTPSEFLFVIYKNLKWYLENDVLDNRIFEFECDRSFESLDVRWCDLSGVTFPTNLQSLNVSGCNLSGVTFPTNLQSLDVRWCNLSGVTFPTNPDFKIIGK